jgi:8-oxo-dGTP pyrophosphatase MutT (NUDIX family)
MPETDDLGSAYFDAFISYNRADRDWVGSVLLPRLEREGLRVCIDTRDFKLGALLVESIEVAVERSSRILLVITPNWLGSDWTRFEAALLQTQDLGNRERRILPLLLAPCNLPPRLRIYNYLDLTDPQEQDRQLDRLVEDIRSTDPGVDGPVGGPRAGAKASDLDGLTFVSGAALCGNLLGYSRLLIGKQDAAVGLLRERLGGFLQSLQVPSWLEFHGADFLLFLEREPSQREEEILGLSLALGSALQRAFTGIGMRMGMALHWEPNASRWSLAGREHLVGPDLLEARTLVSFADAGQFLLSRRAYDGLSGLLEEARRLGLESPLHEIQRRYGIPLDDLTDGVDGSPASKVLLYQVALHDWEKLPHEVYNLAATTGERATIGEERPPAARVRIEHRDPRRTDDPHQEFIQRLVEADEAYVIGLTHEGTAMFLRAALDTRRRKGRGFWERLLIVFPAERFMENLIDQHPTPLPRKERMRAGKRMVTSFLLGLGREHFNRWDCIEYEGAMPFVGNRFVGERLASVRIAPILPGADMKKTYYTEIFEGMPVYEQLVDAFSVICNRGVSLNEWDLYGTCKDLEFRYHGLVSRKRLESRSDYWFPVVLIILHVDNDKGRHVLLQHRTIYNGDEDVDTFSNISGRLTDRDVYAAVGVDDVPSYLGIEDPGDGKATAEFSERTGLTRKAVLPIQAWEAGAVRELQEELGLEIDPERLKSHTRCLLTRKKGNLVFHIFSLQLRADESLDEVEEVEQIRPHAELQMLSRHEIEQLQRDVKLNTLLQNRYEDVFRPILEELNIG